MSDRITRVALAVREILECMDEVRPETEETPYRVAKFLLERSRTNNLPEESLSAIFPESFNSGQKVSVEHVPFFSLCEHHMLPYFGHVSITYTTNGKVLGFSKLARLVEAASRGLTMQERVTDSIAEAIYKKVDAKSVSVKIVAQHTCMTLRGARALGSEVTTIATRGEV